MFQTFNENQYYLQSQLLRHGELDWLVRNTYFGDQRNYLETDIDDNFLSDDVWDTTTHSTDFNPADALREVPDGRHDRRDMVKAANNFRIDMLFNGGGSVAFAAGCTQAVGGDSGSGGSSTGCDSTAGPDPLLAKFQSNDPLTGKPYTDDFGWINHTWDHPNIDEGCATQNYIEAELNQNTNWGSTKPGTTAGDPNGGGLGLTSSTDPTAALGTENPNVVITGEHSGIANLLPGNPGQVDPPSLDTAAVGTAAGVFGGTGDAPVGDYVYGVTDQFNTAAPGATPVAGTGQSAASVSSPVTVAANQSIDLTWGAVCHAAQYTIYRAPYTAATTTTPASIGAWVSLGTVLANTTNDFTNPTSTTNTTGGGAIQKTFTDTGTAGTATGSTGDLTATSIPADEGAAVESPYEQNPVLDNAFKATLNGGIKYFGSDASKPYPSPPDGTFATGTYTGATYPAGATFQDAGASAIPRYPTNIYYNVGTNAQEIDEYTTLYDSPPGTGQTGTGQCKDIPNVTTCYPYNQVWTIADITASVDQGMFQHMMGNDPRPHYFHQTNLMDQTLEGDGLFYETLNPLLTQYNAYFASNAPIVQLTMAQIGTLLNEQAGWAAANKSQISGYIDGSTVTVTNNGLTATEIPLTGVLNVGTAYAGTQSGWTSAQPGANTYTALAAWPALPTTPAIPTPPTGPAPGGPPATGGKPINQTPPSPAVAPAPAAPLYYVAVQVAPKKVSMKKGTATVSLKCEAKNGKAAKNHFCTGKFTLKVMGKTVTHSFRIKATKTAHISVKLPKKAMLAAAAAAAHTRHVTWHAGLVVSTKQPNGPAKVISRDVDHQDLRMNWHGEIDGRL